MILGVDPDQITGIQDTITPIFDQVGSRFYAFTVVGGQIEAIHQKGRPNAVSVGESFLQSPLAFRGLLFSCSTTCTIAGRSYGRFFPGYTSTTKKGRKSMISALEKRVFI